MVLDSTDSVTSMKILACLRQNRNVEILLLAGKRITSADYTPQIGIVVPVLASCGS